MLYDKLKNYSKSGIYPFHMPGHKRTDITEEGIIPYNIDITEIHDFDNLHSPNGVIYEIQKKAAKLYNAKNAFILINGSTGGILSAIRSMTNQGDKILMARNCHKSVYNAAELFNLNVDYIFPDTDSRYNILTSVSPYDIEDKLTKHNDEIRLVIITSPTYEGVVSDIKSISEICHKHGAKLLVDEAHGAHFPFSDSLPDEALNCGADAAVLSLHKTLPSLTQTALLITNDSELSEILLEACENATFADSKGDHTFASDEDVYNFGTDEAGVYYVKVTGQPAETSVKKKGGALFALPEGTKTTQGSAEAPIELKINTGEVTVSKEIVGPDIDTKHTTASAGDTVTFKLTASVTGSKEVPLTEYTIHDNLSDSFRDPAVTEVMVGSTKLQEGTDYTVDKTNLLDIQISLTSDYLANAKKAEGEEGSNDFYASSDVVVTLTAILKDTAASGYNTTDNSNSDSLTYTNTYGQTSKPGDDTVYVYTFDLPVFKYDGTTTDKTGLGNATFELKTKEGTLIDTKTTDSSGNVTFAKLAAGTYTVQETKAPSGYNLNSSEYTVVISTTGVITVSVDGNSSEVNQVEVPDYPVTVPSTGGMGTMMFYVGGAALIACAGVLLFVLKRKKAAK